MSRIAILPCDVESRGTYLSTQTLPDDYMSDFSLMGFVVEHYNDALNVLESAGYTLEKHEYGAEVHIDDHRHLLKIQKLFSLNNLTNSYSDVADTLYQA